MKKRLTLASVTLFSALISMSSFAGQGHLKESPALNANPHMSAQGASAVEKQNPVKELIRAHMLNTGYATQAEFDARDEEISELRAMIESLRAAGDREGIKALHEFHKEKARAFRSSVKAYVDSNPDLKDAIHVTIADWMQKRMR